MSLKEQESIVNQKEYEDTIRDLAEIIMEQLDEMPTAVALRVLANLQGDELMMRAVLGDDELLAMKNLSTLGEG